jgi:hypothetical protein
MLERAKIKQFEISHIKDRGFIFQMPLHSPGCGQSNDLIFPSTYLKTEKAIAFLI